MKVANVKDLKSGALFAGFGILGAVLSLEYDMGTLSKMGPGYFPFLVSSALAVVGLSLCLRSLLHHPGSDSGGRKIQHRVLIGVLGSVLLFALTLRFLGLLPSSFLLVFVSSMANRRWRPLESAVVAIVLSFLVVAIFVLGLGMPLQIWPEIIARQNPR